MTWLKIDDGFDENMKIEPLCDRAFRLHISALCLCSRKLSDGHISATSLKGMLAKTSATKRHVQELVDAELWLPALGGGHVIKDFLHYNRSREQVLDDREKARDRMNKLRSGSSEQPPNVPPNNERSSGVGSPSPSFALGKSKTRSSADAKKREPQTVDFAARAALAQANKAQEGAA